MLLLNDKGSLSYTEIMNSLEINNTGRINYHLKILDNLVEKNELGYYALTEKGRLALRLLQEFPEEQHEQKMESLRRKILFAIFFQVAWITAIIALYFIGVIDIIWVARSITFLIAYTIFSYLIYLTQKTRSKPGSVEDTLSMKIVYTSGGIGLALCIAFFGVGVVFRILSDLLGEPLLQTVFWSEWYLVFSLLIMPITGGFIGYLLGKRKGFKRFELKIFGYRL